MTHSNFNLSQKISKKESAMLEGCGWNDKNQLKITQAS